MKNEIEELIQEQIKLQTNIDKLQGDQDDEQTKNRQLEREINELNIQLSSNKMTSGYAGALEEPRVSELRDNIAKKQMQISQAQRDYKDILENPPKNRPIYSSSPKGNSYDRSAAPSNEQLLKLESEIGDIKKML
jgi:predicted nuclease with TOPRIM domain